MDQLNFMQEKLATMKTQCQAKIECAERWRIQMKAKYKVSEAEEAIPAEMLVFDPESIDELIKKMVIRVDHPEDKKQFEQLFRDYVQKVKDRELQIQKLTAKGQNMKNHIEELKENKEKDQKRLIELEQDNIKLKNDYNVICMNEKALEQQKEDRQSLLEIGLFKQGEDDFNDFLKKNEQVFKDVKKTYGKKILEKIKQEHKKEIGELAISQQLERRNAIRELHNAIQHITSVVDSHDAVAKLARPIQEVKII